jgi:phosphatidylethanolamine/phosphatidyl-N-methylethanolamine N-methyltransferase
VTVPPRRAPRPPEPAGRDERRGDTGAFYREWLKRPLEVAALSPSSAQLAAAVAAAASGARTVVELGGGTGAVTGALAAVPGRRLIVVEYNPSFAAVLRARFPDATVVEGDARHAVRLVAGTGVVAPGEVDVVVSGLGMLTRTREEQRVMLAAMFELLSPAGHMVQYTYSPVFPAAKGLLEEMGLEAKRAAIAFFNLPPASVFVVRRRA